jgi:K+-sensing histidine kinase KdpD
LSEPQKRNCINPSRKKRSGCGESWKTFDVTRISEDRATKIIKTPEVVEEIVAAAGKFRSRFPRAAGYRFRSDEVLICSMDPLLKAALLNLLQNARYTQKTRVM